jgi:hypothetical protein
MSSSISSIEKSRIFTTANILTKNLRKYGIILLIVRFLLLVTMGVSVPFRMTLITDKNADFSDSYSSFQIIQLIILFINSIIDYLSL